MKPQAPTSLSQRHHQRYDQKGIALILFVMVIILAFTTVFVSSRSHNALKLKRNQTSLDALNQAKSALIAFAAATETNPPGGHPPGGLPCPDANNDGRQDLSGGGNACATYRGWLPFLDLGMADLRDASGERLWYALSANFRANTPNTLNSDTQPNLSINSNTNYIAIVIAPGERLDGQGPRATHDFSGTGNSNQAQRYLEQANAQNPITDYASRPPNENLAFNDILIGITPKDLFPAVEQRVAGDLINALRAYKDSTTCDAPDTLPFAANFGDVDTNAQSGQQQGAIALNTWGSPCPSLPAWFASKGWQRLTYYAFCLPTTSDCLEYCRGTTNCSAGDGTTTSAVVIVAGRALPTQTNRLITPTALDQFFEHENHIQNGIFVQLNPNINNTNYNDTLRAF